MVRKRFAVASRLVCCLIALSASVIGQEVARPSWTTSKLQGAPEPPAPYRIIPAFPNLRFQKPSSIEEIPGTNQLLVTQMDGKLFGFPKVKNTSEVNTVGDLAELVGGSVSLLDAEFHPQFITNRYVFLCYVHPGNDRHTRVSRFTLSDSSPLQLIPSSERVIITWPAGGHNAGCLEFGKDGFLLIATGDGSGPNPPDGLTTGQDVSDLLGAILRIDVNRIEGDQSYAVPADNPFVHVDRARPEIWAYGLRNPWKFGVDSATGDVFAADNGWETWESVHRIVRGGNCGWPVMEGRAILRSEVPVGPTPILPPVKDHSHTEANSVIGGPVYRGLTLPGLVGSFIYGDYITGTIWSVRREADESYSHQTLVDTDLQIVGFTEGRDGELYVLDYDFTGQIYELLPSGAVDNSANFPRLLSQTGLFTAVETLQPSPGVVPYEVEVEPWTDGAAARRWVAIPGNAQIELAIDDKPAAYPNGTVFVKHLTLPLGAEGQSIPLETQILHFEDGTWRPYSYLWDESGKDARLVDSIGANRSLQAPDSDGNSGRRTWHVNAINECKLCHNAAAGSVLGFVPQQLKQRSSILAARRVLTTPATLPENHPLQLVNPQDTSKSLNDRARSYLHVNCSMCHHPRGNAIVSFYLRRDMPFEQLNTNKGTGIGTFGIRNAKIIAPGDPNRSVLLYRMSKLGYARMPYIGSQVVDSAGVALIDAWLKSMPSDGSAESSPLLRADSSESVSLRWLARADGTRSERDSAISNLIGSTEGALALLVAIHGRTLMKDDLQSAVALGSATADSNIRGLFETFIPESQRVVRLGADINPETILSKQGDAARGKLIFYSDGARCKACHEVRDKDQSLGTTLSEINKKYPNPADLLSHVLQPSKKVDEPFAAYAVITTDGRTYSGLLSEATAEAIVIKTLDRKLVRILRSEIEELQKGTKSLMPDQILSDLTPQEAADLLAYIKSVPATE